MKQGLSIFVRIFVAAVVVLAAGCGGTTGNGQPDGGDGYDTDGCQGAGQRKLSIVGSPNREIKPGEEIELAVALLERCVGAVPGEAVAFEIVQNPGSASLSAPSVTTNENGVATVNLAVAQSQATTQVNFGVHATHIDDPQGVYFTITLKPPRHKLSTVTPSSLSCYTGEALELQVKVSDDYTGAPVGNIELGFSIVNPPPGGDASIRSPHVSTNLSGIASTVFDCGSQAVTYTVEVAGTQEQLEKAFFSIDVVKRQQCQTDDECPSGFTCINSLCEQSGVSRCASDDDCPAGYVCDGGHCRPEDVLPSQCETADDCPPGYYCEAHTCYPCPEVCNDPACQVPNCEGGDCTCPDCMTCPDGFVCVNGNCIPDNPDNPEIPDIGGTWYVKHFFDTSGALGGATANTIVQKLNQIINYCDITGIGMIDDILCDIIHQYVPDWAGTLINIFANIYTMLRELRAEGYMEVTHLNPPELISATEQWETIFIRYLEACCSCFPNCQPGQCNPYDNPSFPDCGTVDIYRTDLEVGELVINIHPYTGKIHVDDSGPITKYTLQIDPRNVEIEYSKFVAYLVDLLIQMFTGYDNLEDALMDIIDCVAIGDFAAGICYDMGLDGFLVNCDDVGNSAAQACNNFKPQADELIKTLLDQIGIGWKYLKFSGWATIGVIDDTPPYGVTLGTPDFEQSGDGHWEGNVKIIVSSDMPGAWYGER